MRLEYRILFVALGVLLAVGPALAQQAFIYPNKGQSADQQNTDRGSCEGWARQQTGYDPMTGGSAPAAPAEAPKGGVVRGAARGAVGGAVVGAIAGDAGKGAAIGAAGGGVVGGARRADQRRDQAAQAQQQQAAQQQGKSEYMRAFGACMEGKGYTVK